MRSYIYAQDPELYDPDDLGDVLNIVITIASSFIVLSLLIYPAIVMAAGYYEQEKDFKKTGEKQCLHFNIWLPIFFAVPAVSTFLIVIFFAFVGGAISEGGVDSYDGLADALEVLYVIGIIASCVLSVISYKLGQVASGDMAKVKHRFNRQGLVNFVTCLEMESDDV